MLLAQYRISKTGKVVSREIPLLAEDESLRITRESYKGQSSILLEVVDDCGHVSEQIMFAGLVDGRFGVTLGSV